MASFYEVITPAANNPVSLAEAKAFLRVEHSVDDTIITALISAATLQGEKCCGGRAFVERDFKAYFGGICDSSPYPFIEIARSPLMTLTSIKVMSGGSLTDVSVSDYELQKRSDFSRILFFTLPIPDTDVAYPYEVEFTAGYGDETKVPEDIKTAIKEHVNFLYENRGDVSAINEENMPAISQMIYRTGYRIISQF